MRIRKKLLCATLTTAFFVTPVLAQTVDEVEPNNSIGTPQVLQFNGETAITVRAAVGDASGLNPVADVDYYSFEGTVDDIVTIDIDCGDGCGLGGVDTTIALFGDGPDYLILRENDDAGDLDDGSVSPYDARIDNFSLPYTGRYYVAVTNTYRQFVDGGSVTGTTVYNGDYTLNVSGISAAVVDVPPPVVDVPPPVVDVPPPVVEVPPTDLEAKLVNIRIMPGRIRRSAPINPRSHEKIPVAILSTETFDPMGVDKTSLTFGQTGEEASLARCNERGIDLNRDGRPDMVCHFRNRDAGFDQYTLEAKLAGKMLDGTRIEGQAPLKVTPHKRSYRDHHRRDGDGRHNRHRSSR